jgi:hypothetical protein
VAFRILAEASRLGRHSGAGLRASVTDGRIPVPARPGKGCLYAGRGVALLTPDRLVLELRSCTKGRSFGNAGPQSAVLVLLGRQPGAGPTTTGLAAGTTYKDPNCQCCHTWVKHKSHGSIGNVARPLDLLDCAAAGDDLGCPRE